MGVAVWSSSLSMTIRALTTAKPPLALAGVPRQGRPTQRSRPPDARRIGHFRHFITETRCGAAGTPDVPRTVGTPATVGSRGSPFGVIATGQSPFTPMFIARVERSLHRTRPEGRRGPPQRREPGKRAPALRIGRSTAVHRPSRSCARHLSHAFAPNVSWGGSLAAALPRREGTPCPLRTERPALALPIGARRGTRREIVWFRRSVTRKSRGPSRCCRHRDGPLGRAPRQGCRAPNC
jgi:hypothetical protein